MKLGQCFFTKRIRLAVAFLLILSMLSLNYAGVVAQSSSFGVQAITMGTGVSTIVDLPTVATSVATGVGTTIIAPHTAGTTIATSVSSIVGTTKVGSTVSTTVVTTTPTTVATTTATATNTFRPGMGPGDFSIDLSSASLTIVQGSSGNVQASVASYNYASPVSLTFSGTSGITGSFSTNPVTTSAGISNFYVQWATTAATSMLSISVPTSVASGVYPVTVTGSSASFYHSVTLALNVAVSTMPSSMNSVNIANKPGIGSYLTNATGWTLYTFARDIPTNGTSRCTGNYCVKNWPVFYAANLTLSQRLNATSFTVITRPDGGKQIAYNGWPLYYFRNDTTPGDTKGQGFAKAWSVCTFPTPFTIITSTTTTSAVTAAEREGY